MFIFSFISNGAELDSHTRDNIIRQLPVSQNNNQSRESRKREHVKDILSDYTSGNGRCFMEIQEHINEMWSWSCWSDSRTDGKKLKIINTRMECFATIFYRDFFDIAELISVILQSYRNTGSRLYGDHHNSMQRGLIGLMSWWQATNVLTLLLTMLCALGTKNGLPQTKKCHKVKALNFIWNWSIGCSNKRCTDHLKGKKNTFRHMLFFLLHDAFFLVRFMFQKYSNLHMRTASHS